ncbi:MAG: tRNA (adenosine(37)-N6)-dimethylallyltransferase MiaA [Rhodothermia bacterium]|nr:MAG: tRNA (adenosine(37)-N6)-dimethylallyltransferase MiaA [Rhodothermia bacterium]
MRIPIIAGPTAVGKTSVSLKVAESVGAEIISCDSRQIFRQLSIGTAKPSPSELARVRHHLVDELDLDEPYSAGIFTRMAEELITGILDRGHLPMIVGGSTLYLHALLHGLADIPDIDPAVRERLNMRLVNDGSETLYQELLVADPKFASTLDNTKTQRVIRGLEVFEGTGQQLSSFHANQEPPPFEFDLFVLSCKREILYGRIDQRVDQMINEGLIDEVRGILERGTSKNSAALLSIGYQEVTRFVEGELDRDEMIELFKRNTRRYAKRQLTWFRKYEQATWIDLDSGDETKIIESLSLSG